MSLEMLDLDSGRWQRQIEATATGACLQLVQFGNVQNRMRVPLPENWRQLSPQEFLSHARRAEVRLWVDEIGLLWRVSAVGPGTRFPYPLQRRHLVFDSDRAWSGIVLFEAPYELGDLTDLQLQKLRDRMTDFGGRRKGYRAPRGS